MPKKLNENKSTTKVSEPNKPTIAKSDDGTIQITITIPYTDIKKHKEEVANEYSDKVEIPGFRPGKAPLDKVLEKIPENNLLEKILQKILPNLLSLIFKENNIKPAIYPRIELISAQEEKDWQIRAVTCEIPEINLGDYKKGLPEITRTSSIWVPGKDKDNANQNPTREEKEQAVIKHLLETIKFNIPKLLIEEEVNSRLSKLLERIEKLGLSLESYLTSIKKSANDLRKEYEEQSKNAIALDLILSKIAEEENLTVNQNDIDAMIKASQVDRDLAKELDTPEKRQLIEIILRRRKALDFLVSLT